MFLLWERDRVYQHSAFVRSAKAPATLGLGILRSASTIVSPWDGLTIDSRNVLKNKAHPNSQSVQETLRRRGLHLAENKKMPAGVQHIKRRPFEDTGISRYRVVAEAILEEIRRREAHNEAVLLAIPSRNLRDSWERYQTTDLCMRRRQHGRVKQRIRASLDSSLISSSVGSRFRRVYSEGDVTV